MKRLLACLLVLVMLGLMGCEIDADVDTQLGNEAHISMTAE